MNAARLWVIGGVVGLVGILVLAWFAGIQPKLTEAANAEFGRIAAVEANEQNELTIAELKEQFASLGEMEDELAELQVAVPFRLGAPAFVDQINALAAANGVQVQEITMSEARAYGAPAPAAEPEAGGDEETAAGPSADTGDANPAPPAGTAPSSPPAVTDPRITAGNFVAVPVSVAFAGPQSAVLNAIQSLQSGGRLFLVNGVALSPTDADTIGMDAPYTGVVSGFIYVLLDPVAEAELVEAEKAEEG